MAIILRDGFDAYNGTGSGTGMNSRWSGPGGGYMSAGRFGGQSWTWQNNGQGTGFENARVFDSTTYTFTFGCAVKFTYYPPVGMTTTFMRAMTNTYGYQCGLLYNFDGSVSLVRQSDAVTVTVLATSAPNLVPNGVWHYFEWEGFVDASSGYGRVYLNGDPNPIINISNVNTMNTLSTPVARIGIGNSANRNTDTIYYDDLYVLNTATRLGPRRITTLTVNGTGTTTNWVPSTGTDHVAVVDEVVPNTADYLSASNVNDLEELTLQDLTYNPAIIDEVTMIVYASKTDAAARSIKIGLESGPATAESADLYLPNGFARFSSSFPTDPNGNITWTPSAVNGLVARLRISN